MPQLRLAALITIAGLVLVGCAAARESAPLAGPSAPAPGRAPSGFLAVDLTWVSPQQGWALGVAPGCSGQRCATVLETTDGGAKWVTVSDLHACLVEAAPVGCPAGIEEVSSIRFANADVGYAFAADGGRYALTTNGGLTWTTQGGRRVSAIKLARGTAVRVSFSRTGCPGPCDWSVDHSPAGESHWQTLLQPPPGVNHGPVDLVDQGGADLYVAFLGQAATSVGHSPAQLFVSSTAGAQWTAVPDPCGAGGRSMVAVAIAAAPGGAVAALCTPSGSAGSQAVTISSDYGQTFGPPRALPRDGNSRYSELTLTSATDVFAATGGSRLVGSWDGGRHWKVLLRARVSAQDPAPRFLGFESSQVGRWLGPGSTMWTTTDGGHSWHPSHF